MANNDNLIRSILQGLRSGVKEASGKTTRQIKFDMRQRVQFEKSEARQQIQQSRAAKHSERERLRSTQRMNREMARAARQTHRQQNRVARQQIRISKRQARQQVRIAKQAARQQQRINRMSARRTHQFNQHFNEVQQNANQVAPRMSRVARNSSVSFANTNHPRMAYQVRQRQMRSNHMEEAMHANGLNDYMLAEVGANAYHNMARVHNQQHPNNRIKENLDTTDAQIRYGRRYINRGRNLMRDAHASERQTKAFNDSIRRAQGTSITARRLKKTYLRHGRLSSKYSGRSSDETPFVDRMQTDFETELSKRSKLANQLKSNDIAASTDNDGHTYIAGDAKDATTGLGKVSQMAKQGNSTAMEYMASNNAINTYITNFGKGLNGATQALKTLNDNLSSINSTFGNFTNGTTTSEAQARGNPNATFVHYPSATPTGMIQNMGGFPGITTQGAFAAGSAIKSYVGQGDALRQQIEPGINSLSLGNAINGGTDQYHLDNGITDRLMQEGRWNGQTANQMSQYLGALGGTRNTNPTEQTQAAGNEAQFSRNTNVNPTDTSQLFSTLANGGGLGDRNDRGNIVDFTRQFAGMLHNDHLGSVSGQQAQGLNSIFGNMVGSGQTLTPSVVRNITAMQGVLSSGPGGRAFQGQQGAQQLNNFSQGVGSQFGDMLVRNAFAGANPRYGGQQGLYQLGLDMQEPFKHPQQLTGMIQNLASSGLGPAGTQLELTQMGLSPDNAKQMYNQVMSGKLNPGSLKKIEQQNNAQGGSTESHTNKQYRMQGNSTLDIKVAMGQQGKLHSSEAFDSTRNGMNHVRSLYDQSGTGALGAQSAKGIGQYLANTANIATIVGMFTGRGSAGSSLGRLFQNSKHPRLRKFGRRLSHLASGGNGSGGAINSHGNRFSNNYFYDNHFMGGSGGSSSGSGDNGTGNGSDNSSSSSSDNSSNSSSGNSSDDTDDEAHDDKESDLKDERDKALKNGDKGKAKELDQHIADLERDKRNGGGLGDRAMRWLGHGRTGNALRWLGSGKTGKILNDSSGHLRGLNKARGLLNWAGHGSTGNAGRWVANHIHPGTASVAAVSEPTLNKVATSNLASKTATPSSSALEKGASMLGGPRGASLTSKAGELGGKLKGPLAVAAMIPAANDYLDHPTWNKTKDLGSDGVNGAVDSMSGPIGWGLTAAQLGGGAIGNATGNKAWNAVSRIANVGDDIFHPIKNGKGILSDLKSAGRFGLHHPVQALASINPATMPLEEMYRHRHGIENGIRNFGHGVRNFARHPLRTTGRGLHRLGLAVGRGWRGLKRGIGGLAGGALRGVGGLGRTILGRGGTVALIRNYMYLRLINRMLPRLASKLEGLFGESGLSGNKGSSSNASGMQNAQENAESVSQNNGNTTNNDNSNHDDHSTNNYFMGYPGQGGTGAQSLTTPMMDFFSHSHGTAAS